MEDGSENAQALIGYACLAAGVLDGLVALFLLLTEKPSDARVRRNLVTLFAISAVGIAGIGVAFLLGVFAREG